MRKLRRIKMNNLRDLYFAILGACLALGIVDLVVF